LATKIRLKRIGRRNRPFYRVIITDSRNRRDGAAIEEIGWFNPLEKNDNYEINQERVLHWLKLGAQPSKAIHNLMKHSGLAYRWHLMRQGLDENSIEKEMKKWLLNREDILKQRELSKKEKKQTAAAEKAEEIKAEVKETAPEETAAVEAPAEKTEEAPAVEVEVKETAPEETAAVEAPAEKTEEAPAVEDKESDKQEDADKEGEPEVEDNQQEKVEVKAETKSAKTKPKKKTESKSTAEKKESPKKEKKSKTEKVDNK